MDFIQAVDCVYNYVKINKIDILYHYLEFLYKCAWMRTKDIKKENHDFVTEVLSELSGYNTYNL